MRKVRHKKEQEQLLPGILGAKKQQPQPQQQQSSQQQPQEHHDHEGIKYKNIKK